MSTEEKVEQIVRIFQGGNLVGVLVVQGIMAAMKLKSLFELSPDFDVNVQELSEKAISADESTMSEVNEWRLSVGLQPLSKEDASGEEEPEPEPEPEAEPPS